MSMTSALREIARIGTFFLLLTSGHAVSSPMLPDATSLLAEIHGTGARQVIARLNAKPNPNAWDGVIERIRTGQQAWLDVAAVLAQDADAGSASDLKISLAYALVKNPEGVLKLTGSQGFLNITEVCGAPFIEPTDRFLKRYLAQARQAVARVDNPQSADRQAACLAQLDDAERQLRSLRKAGR